MRENLERRATFPLRLAPLGFNRCLSENLIDDLRGAFVGNDLFLTVVQID
jgi:hypothetical protein